MSEMKLYALKKSNLDTVLARWNQEIPVYIPTGKGKDINLQPMDQFERTEDYINLTLPVKEMVFEQKEKLFSWDRSEDGDVKVENLSRVHTGDRIFYGIRACDTYGIAYTDRFYLKEFFDDNYKSRRDKATIVAVNCLRSGKSCFCTSVGTDVFSTTGFDLALTELDDTYLVESATEKGAKLIEWASEYFEPAASDMPERKEALRQKVADSFSLKMDMTNIWDDLARTFDADFWIDEANACIACTGCTNVCPTCTCFNIVEEKKDADSGERVRYWDSCQSEHFTRNAEYHQPRNALSRVRYRIYDKLKYIEERFGYKGCSGCGRCADVCPTYISIIDIIQSAQKEVRENPDLKPAVHQIADMKHEIIDREVNVIRGLYAPDVATITRIEQDTPEIKRMYVKYDDPSLHDNYEFKGQFFQLTVFGEGEVALSIPFGPDQKDEFDFDFKNVGSVTKVLYDMKVGDKVGLRGPYGKAYPTDELKGRDLLFVGSGVALAPLRSVLVQVLEKPQDFGRVVIMTSAKRYEGMIYKEELKEWAQMDGVEVYYAVKEPTEEVQAYTGFINDLLPDLGMNWENTTALVCASPSRIKKVAKDLLTLGVKPADILVTLETHMRCGAGKCGHCKVGSHYMCVDGPVFNYEEMQQLPPEY
jgi:NAD(P)H-flavin reductase/formate hydrogenlyase subunit 6/NADH:ubiquinone oxidoreductase subunit I